VLQLLKLTVTGEFTIAILQVHFDTTTLTYTLAPYTGSTATTTLQLVL
jgi:hypothetical protein